MRCHRGSQSEVRRIAIAGALLIAGLIAPAFPQQDARATVLADQDDVWVDALWASQADVDNDPLLGIAGCNPPGKEVLFGYNAFPTIAEAVAIVNPGGRVHILNGLYVEEDIVVNKPMEIFGEDESVPGCSGRDGRAGVLVIPSTQDPANKAIFRLESSDVQIRDLSIDGDNPALTGTVNASYGVAVEKSRIFTGQTDIDDAQITASSPNQNDGANTVINVDGANPNAHAVIKFPTVFGGGPSQIPLGAVIVKAEMMLNCVDVGDPAVAYRLLYDWRENQVTWNNRITGTPWPTPGADVPSHTGIGVPFVLNAAGWQRIDLTPLFQDWSNGAPNNGFVVMDGGGNGIDWESSESANSPILKVIWENPLDPTDLITNIRLENLFIQRLASHGAWLMSPGGGGFRVIGCDFQRIGDVIGGDSGGAAVIFGGASGRIIGGRVFYTTSGVQIFGGGYPGGLLPVSGSGAAPNVLVEGVEFLAVGGGVTQGDGAVSFLGNATGSVRDCYLEGFDRGVQIGWNEIDGTVLVENNALVGPMRIGVDVHHLYAPGVSPASSEAWILGNSFEPTCEQAGISIRHVGADEAGVRNPGGVEVSQNVMNDWRGLGGLPDGLYIHNVPVASGFVNVDANQLDAAGSSESNAGVAMTTRDTRNEFPASTARAMTGVTVQDNTLSGWFLGVQLGDPTGASAAPAIATIGTIAGNTIAACGDGIRLDGGATAVVGGVPADPEVVRNCNNGIRLVTGTSSVEVRTSNLDGNIFAGLSAAGGSEAFIEDCLIQTSATVLGGAGVLIPGPGGATVDMGGGLLGSAGSNIFNVRGPDAWAVEVRAVGDYSATDNLWQYDSAQYAGAVAVDDLIRDGDPDNFAGGGEGFTFGPLHFFPFAAGPQDTPLTLEDNYIRGVTPDYGVTAFRALSDAVEVASTGGQVDVAEGSYFSLRYNPLNSEYEVPGMPLERPITIQSTAPGLSVVYPALNGPGTAVADIRQPGSATLFEVQSHDVALADLVLDGDNPSIGGGRLVNGVDVNARNAVVIDGEVLDGPDRFRATGLEVRNFYYYGIVTESTGAPSQLFETPTVQLCRFYNIDGFVIADAGSTAVGVVDSQVSRIDQNTVELARYGIVLLPDDDTSRHDLTGNVLIGTTQKAIVTGEVRSTAWILVEGNTVDGFGIGIQVAPVDAGGQVYANGNSIGGAFNYGLTASSVAPTGFIGVGSNIFQGPGSGVGIATTDVAAGAGGEGVHIVGNLMDGFTTAIMVTNQLTGLRQGPNHGTRILGNVVANSVIGIATTAVGGPIVRSLVGGTEIIQSNTVTGCTTGILVAGASANSEIDGNLTIDDNEIGVDVRGAGAAIVRRNRISQSAQIGVRVSGVFSEALIEENFILGGTNQIGIQIENDARASMGPGDPANDLTDAFFAVTASIGYNRLRDYPMSIETRSAIRNLSVLDQNAGMNDFNIDPGSCSATDPDDPNLPGPDDRVENVVWHQFDDPAVGEVLFCPPLVPYTKVQDWRSLNFE